MRHNKEFSPIDLNEYIGFLKPYKNRRDAYECPNESCSNGKGYRGKLTFNRANGTEFSCHDCGDRAAIRLALKKLSGEYDKEKEEWTKEKQQERERERELWLQNLEYQKEQERKKFEISSRRDVKMRREIADNPLKQKDRDDLHRRGLSDRVIAKYEGYSTWGSWSFPAVNLQGYRMAAQHKVLDEDKLVYKWIKKGDTKRHETGQHPLMVIGNKENPSIIALVEGLALKPILTAESHPDWQVTGAAGGQFAHSSQETIEVVNAFPDIPIVWMADGGSIEDKGVMQRIEAAYNLIKLATGREMLVGTWEGQEKKGGTDIDEIPLGTKIKYIPLKEFKSRRDIVSRVRDFAVDVFKGIFNRKPRPIFTRSGLGRDPVDYYYKIERSETYEYGDDPIVVYDVSDQERAIAQAIKSGAKVILDSSSAGQGKSTGSALMRDLPVDKVILVVPAARNLSTTEAKNSFALLPGRADMLYLCHDRTMPDGSPYIAVTKPTNGTYTTIPGNCPEAREFSGRQSLGYDGEGQQSPCRACRYQSTCAQPPIDEDDNTPHLLYERKNALSQSRIVVSLGSFPLLEKTDLSKSLVIFDDCKPITEKSLSISAEQLKDVVFKITIADSELAVRLSPLFRAIADLGQTISHHGFDDAAIRNKFAEYGYVATEEDLNKVAAIMQPDFTAQRLADIPPNAIQWLLEVLLGKVYGVARMVKDTLIVKHEDRTHINILSRATTLILDATQAKSRLSLEMGIEPDEIAVISQVEPDVSNTSIHLIRGAGTPTKDRAVDRVDLVKAAIGTRHGKVSVLDKKGFGDGDRGVQFRDNRGSNAYENDDAILSVGLHCLNMGAVADSYSILTGEFISATSEDEGFREYLRALNAAEEIQAVGRLRSQRRPNKQLHYYLWADSDKVPIEEIMAAYPGATLIEEQMIDLCPAAASKRDRTRLWFIQNAQKNPSISQQQMADATNLSASTISALCKPFGGYRKTLGLLLSISIAFQKFQNSELVDWESLISTPLVDYTIRVLEDDSPPLETATEIEQIIEPLSSEQMVGLLAAIGKPRSELLISHLYALQLHRDNEMKLAETGDSIDDLAEGLQYIVRHGDIIGLEALREAHYDDKESMQRAASLLSQDERDLLKEMVMVGNKIKALRELSV